MTANTEASPPPSDSIQAETWNRFQTALADLLRESRPESQPADGAETGELRKMVTEAVSAVLLESDLLDKLVQRTLVTQLRAEGGLGEEIRALCMETLREFSMQTFGPLMKSEIKDIVQTRLTEFSNTEEFKDLLDGRFRTMEQYIRSDVIPSVVKRSLKEMELA